MADQRERGIAWTDQTWNPVRGCTRVSEGCRNCYAERVAARFSGAGQPYHGLAVMKDEGPRWTGEVHLVEEHLGDPIRWKRPRRVFVNSMSDLFHEKLPGEAIARVWSVMEQADQHQFQVLTKRAKRMRGWTSAWLKGRTAPPNVWLGVSVEDQAAADARIPELLKTPAAIRFLSVEPQIGSVDLARFFGEERVRRGNGIDWHGPGLIDWVIVGGESGPGARPFDVQWARSIVDQCKAAGVACFVKQLGSEPGFRLKDEEARGNTFPSFHHYDEKSGLHVKRLGSRKGDDPAEWPPEIRVREFPSVTP